MAVCFLTPIYTLSEKRPLISDHIKGPLVATFRSPLMKALDRSVETLGLWIVTSSVTFIESVNQSSIKPCLIWTCKELKYVKGSCKCWAPCCLQAPTSWLSFHIIIIVIISSFDSNSTVFYSLKFVLE